MGIFFDKIMDLRNVMNAFKLIKKGHSENYSMMKFESNLMTNISNILESIENKTYDIKGYRILTVREPKHRNIYAPYIEDRLVQQMIYSIIEPYLDKKMDDYSCACRKGKGVEYARNKCQRIMRQKSSIWYVKLDIDKYFASINHEVLKSILRKHIKDKEILFLLDKFIGNGFGEVGIPIGNLLSQLFANLYLNELDKFVRLKTKTEYYVRYMDDFICFTDSKEKANEIKKQVFDFVENTLKLSIDNRKVKLQQCKYGIVFLGHKIKPKTQILSRKKTRKLRQNVKSYIESSMKIDLHHTFVNLIPKDDLGFLKSIIDQYNRVNFNLQEKILILKTLCKKFQVFLYMEKFNLEEKRNGFKFWY